ncbi:NADPH-dependent FMN reductase [uncultured Muriicola sp.]|uniref:NADPH-dependent FMN reductase n=1 Tax=uncultured Muriicola sp. TaxID=1583102 RepID=UPI002638EC47|nr:NAD(P)H-dependent oxidoreductase [uncultured Muriicola sp.]
MSSIMAFAGSNSSTSINFALVKYTVSLLSDQKVQVMNMALFDLEMFSEDYEKKHGYTNSLIELRDDLHKADGLILSVNEHNSNPSAYFKNLIDWLSRLERKFLENTKIFLMSTSYGKRGGMSSLAKVEEILPRFGGEVVATFSLPSFKENFDAKKGIIDADLSEAHQKAFSIWLHSLSTDK